MLVRVMSDTAAPVGTSARHAVKLAGDGTLRFQCDQDGPPTGPGQVRFVLRYALEECFRPVPLSFQRFDHPPLRIVVLGRAGDDGEVVPRILVRIHEPATT